MKHKLIVFDWDGTLMDSASKIVNCFVAAIRDVELRIPGQDEVRGVIGLGLAEAFTTLLPGATRRQCAMLVDRYRDHYLKLDGTATPMFPGVMEHLARLRKQGYLLAVATGKARRGLQQVLTDTATSGLFTATRCADEARSKPHPQMLWDILDETGVMAHDALMVGDTIYDLQMANEARVDALAVTYGVHQADWLKRYNPVACVDTFREVYVWINGPIGLQSAAAHS